MANVHISIGSDNLDAQFGRVLLHRKPRGKGSTLGSFAVRRVFVGADLPHLPCGLVRNARHRAPQRAGERHER